MIKASKKPKVSLRNDSIGFDEDYVYYVTPEDEREVLLEFSHSIDSYEEPGYDYSTWKLN